MASGEELGVGWGSERGFESGIRGRDEEWDGEWFRSGIGGKGLGVGLRQGLEVGSRGGGLGARLGVVRSGIRGRGLGVGSGRWFRGGISEGVRNGMRRRLGMGCGEG